jgi:hypothetical protein
VRPTLLAIALLLIGAVPLPAQRDGRVQISLPAAQDRGRLAPSIGARNVLHDHSLQELLHSGFPARLHYRLELWEAGTIFDDLKNQIEWDVIVSYNPLERRYAATRIEPGGEHATSLGSYTTLAGIDAALARPFQPPLRPPTRRSRFYYIVALDVQMLSVNDLDEVQRWLRGELSPAVRGERNPGTAIGRGAKTLITRLLGGEERHYQERTGIFRP